METKNQSGVILNGFSREGSGGQRNLRGGIGAIIAIGLMIGFLADVPETRLCFLSAFPSASSLGSFFTCATVE